MMKNRKNEMERALVSVIVPVYNVMPFLTECLESIVRQTYPHLQILLIDDGSSDGSSEICDAYAQKDARITVVHQKNQGVVTARNVGIQMAAGDFILFVDGDNLISPDMAECLLDQIQECDLISSGICQELKGNKKRLRHDEFPEGIYQGEKLNLIRKNLLEFDEEKRYYYLTPFLFNKMYKASFLKQTYRSVPANLSYSEDMVLTCLNLLNCSSVAITHRCFYQYRYRENSAVHRVNRNRLIEINQVYLVLYEIFMNSEWKNDLMIQLERWLTIQTFHAVNYQMGFSVMGNFAEFQIDLAGLEDKRVVLYGAGKMGCDCFRQFRTKKINVVAWVDQRYDELKKRGMNIDAIEKINEIEFDLIWIAVSQKADAEEILRNLQKRGIDKEKLVWKKPVKISY